MASDENRGTVGDVHEVEFATRDSSFPFVGASEAEDCVLELAEILPRDDGEYGEFFIVEGAEPDLVAERAASNDEVEALVHESREREGLLEFVAEGGCPAVTLAELGALPRTVRGEDGEGRIVAEVPPKYDPKPVIRSFLDEYPESELAAKREKGQLEPMVVESAFRRAAERRLTDRQREVLRAALEAGYYDWPRQCTGEEVAEELDITSATFSQHIQAAERDLLELVFENT